MPLGGGMSCVKYLLFAFNLLFAITGLIILVTGITVEIKSQPYVDLTDEQFYTSAPVVLIIIGIIVFIVAFFGCCGAVKENHCMIVTFSVFLLMIFIAELSVGIAGYVKRDDLAQSITRRLNETIKEYPDNADIRKTFDIMQTDWQCCGIKSPDDWVDNKLPYPASCCAAQNVSNNTVEACTKKNSEFHTTGCLTKLVTFFEKIGFWLGGIGLGIAFIQLLGVMFACCLARSIRSQYETV